MAQISEGNAQALISVLQSILSELGKGPDGSAPSVERARDELAGLTEGSLEYLQVKQKIAQLEADTAETNSDARRQALQEVRNINKALIEQEKKQ